MKTNFLFFILLSLFGSLQAQGWVRQNPNATLAQLTDVDFDGVHGLTVGLDGAILTTNDRGTTWVSRIAPEQADILTTAFVVPGTNGEVMLAGGDSLMLLTKNGGDTWTITYNDVIDVFKFQLMPTGEWMALGSNYGVRSDDDGAFWQPFNLPSLDVTAAHFTSVQHGWASAGGFNEAQVWVTTDAGFHWELRDPLKFTKITDIHMLDDSIGYLTSTGEVYKTTNGGFEWTALHTNPSTTITDMHVVNSDEIWISLDNGNVFYSRTTGNSWTEFNPNLINSNNVGGIYADLDGRVWMAGKYVSMLYSDDFGKTWRDQIPGVKQTLFEPHFFDVSTGIVGGSEGTIMRTMNGGALWEKIQFPLQDNFFGAMMIDASTMVVGSSRGRVYISHNKGVSWDTIGTNLGPITDIYAETDQDILVTTEAGRILETKNGGSSWPVVHENPATRLMAMAFVNEQKGWAVGSNGEILATINGGDVWDPQLSPGKGNFSDVAFTNEQEGWAVSSNFSDSLWFTLDAGVTWRTSKLPYASFWRGVSFTSPDTGWIVGGLVGVGEILRTNDGGQTWTLNHTSPEAFMGVYAVPGKETVWAVGFGGNIMKYSPCFTMPSISGLSGVTEPCVGDTVQYSVVGTNVDLFTWHFPAGWHVFGNSNVSTISVIVGEQPGEVTIRGGNVCGNATEVLSMNIEPSGVEELIISQVKGDILLSNVNNGQFQWILDGALIPEGTGSFWMPVVSGTYQLIITTDQGCILKSNALEVTIVATDHIMTDQVSIYPIPANERIHIQAMNSDLNLAGWKLNLYNTSGAKVLSGQFDSAGLDISRLPSGLYILSLESSDKVIMAKVMVE